MSDHLKRIEQAVEKGELRESSARNILEMLVNTRSGLEVASVGELMALGVWEELNDRFYKTLTFGTGGLRGRTIGRIVTKAEQGNPRALGRPEFPCVGDERDELLQHQSSDSGTGEVSARLVCARRFFWATEDRRGA